jgi:hypothetical protein
MIRRFTTVLVVAVLAVMPLAAQQGAPTDHIKLNGVWALEIRNPDGSIAGRTTFHNALTVSGQGKLADLLAGGQPVYQWIVSVNESFITSSSDTATPLCAASGSFNGQCRVFMSNGPFAGFADGISTFATMTLASANGQLVLKGSFVATRAGSSQIERVVTHLQTGQNGTGGDVVFTMATLPSPQAVVEGQMVQFTYTLNFQ